MYAKAGEMLPLPLLLLLPKTNHYKKLYHRKTQPTPNYPHSTYTHTYTHMKLYTRTHTQRGGAHFQLPLFEFGIFHIHIPYSIFHIFQCRLPRLTFQSVWWWQCCTRAPLTVTMNATYNTVH